MQNHLNHHSPLINILKLAWSPSDELAGPELCRAWGTYGRTMAAENLSD